MIKIPTPEFLVLYNGKDEFPDYKEMKLSDSFELQSEAFFLELVVKVYNVNKGRNVEIVNRSPDLRGYCELVAEINTNLKTMDLQSAVTSAIIACIRRDILVHFLESHASEVVNMLFTEWNWDDALEVAKEEGREERTRELLALLESSATLTEAKQKLGLL
ncbi:MAG: hypothetical protein LBU89_00705 [Fibromonadaceae bacterium]|nr:hypothetical protein [Fibromonadaceae bacterium]